MASDFPEISGHRIIRRIGSGGMATVYLAEQLGAGRKVAIKVLLPEHNRDAEAVQRFENEARTIGQLDHPHIVRIFDVGRTTSGEAYFSMPWLPRGDLTVQRDRREPGAIIRNMRALLQALAYAHERGIVHRDVKPENVMFDAAGRPQLADFGIALSTAEAVRLTRPGATVGSSGYMSPEQARGLPTDARSDLYSLGVMLFELLTGDMPYHGPDALSVSIAHVEDPIPPLPAAQAVWQPLIDQAMAKAPGDRFESAADMLAALDAIAPEVLSGSSGHGARWQFVQRWSRHNRGVLVGIAAVLLTIMALALLAYVREHQTRAQEQAVARLSGGSTAAPADQVMLSTAQLDQLIREGNIRLSLGALVDPPGNNAGQRFAKILHTYHNNPEAIAGLASLYDKLTGRIDRALADNDGASALHLYQRAQQLASDAGIRQQEFWQRFVNGVRERTSSHLQRASRHSQGALDALQPMAQAMNLAVPVLSRTSVNSKASDKTRGTINADGAAGPLVVVPMPGGHRVAMGASPVSRAQYARFVRATGRDKSSCRTPGNFFSSFRKLSWSDPGFRQRSNEPVYCASWHDARAYLAWLSQTTGNDYHLPTAAQWRAARQAQPSGMQFPLPTREWLNCEGRCEQASFVDHSGAIMQEDSDGGYSHVGFRVVRELN